MKKEPKSQPESDAWAGDSRFVGDDDEFAAGLAAGVDEQAEIDRLLNTADQALEEKHRAKRH
ncbi:MAG TPA: hypothetical protein VI756_12475 [Blastocatellia bacterium]